MAVPVKHHLRTAFATTARRRVAAATMTALVLLGASGIGSVLPHPRGADDSFLGNLETAALAYQDLINNRVDLTDYLTESQAHLIKDDTDRENLLTTLRSFQTALQDAQESGDLSGSVRGDVEKVQEALDLVIPLIEDEGVVSIPDLVRNRHAGDRVDEYTSAVENLLEDPGPIAERLISDPHTLDAIKVILPDILRAFGQDVHNVDITEYMTEDQAQIFTDEEARGNLLEGLNNLHDAIDQGLESDRTPDERKETLAAVNELLEFVTPIVDNEGVVTLQYLQEHIENLRRISQYQSAIEDLSGNLDDVTRVLQRYPGALDALSNTLPQILRVFASQQVDREINIVPYLREAQADIINDDADREEFLTAARGIRDILQTAITDPATTNEQQERMESVDEMFSIAIPLVEQQGRLSLSYIAENLGVLERINQYGDDVEYLLSNPGLIARGLLFDATTLHATQQMLPKVLDAFNLEVNSSSPLAQALGVPASAPSP